MPAFPERESSILAVLKKKKPGRVPDNEIRSSKSPHPLPVAGTNNHNDTNNSRYIILYFQLYFHFDLTVLFDFSTTNADLLGLSTPPASGNNSSGGLLDVLGDLYRNNNSSNSPSTQQNNAKKSVYK